MRKFNEDKKIFKHILFAVFFFCLMVSILRAENQPSRNEPASTPAKTSESVCGSAPDEENSNLLLDFIRNEFMSHRDFQTKFRASGKLGDSIVSYKGQFFFKYPSSFKIVVENTRKPFEMVLEKDSGAGWYFMPREKGLVLFRDTRKNLEHADRVLSAQEWPMAAYNYFIEEFDVTIFAGSEVSRIFFRGKVLPVDFELFFRTVKSEKLKPQVSSSKNAGNDRKNGKRKDMSDVQESLQKGKTCEVILEKIVRYDESGRAAFVITLSDFKKGSIPQDSFKKPSGRELMEFTLPEDSLNPFDIFSF